MEASSAIVIVIIIISVIGKIVQLGRGRTPEGDRTDAGNAPRREGFSATPYAPSAGRVQSAAVKGFESFKEFIKELEGEGKDLSEPQPRSIRVAKPRPQTAPVKKPAARTAEEGFASTEGEDTLHISHRNPDMPGESVPVASRAAALFASSAELRRAVVMSEILDKPVSLRRRSAR